jgi:drug/metabolite transporter (DMT)-like permease
VGFLLPPPPVANKSMNMETTGSTAHRHAPLWLVATAFAMVYLIWGSTYLGIRYAVESVPPFLMAGSRHLAAGLTLFALARRAARPCLP